MLTKYLCRENFELLLGSRQKLFADPCSREFYRVVVGCGWRINKLAVSQPTFASAVLALSCDKRLRCDVPYHYIVI